MFSVVIPVYNADKYLEGCVKSVISEEALLGQTEILLIDDGSTDRSGELCDRLAEKWGCVKAFHKENGGPSSARNYGIDKASGKYIFFVDSDDYVEKDAFSILKNILDRYGEADIITFGAVRESQNRRESVRKYEPDCVEISDGRNFLLKNYKERSLNSVPWLYVCRKKFLDEKKIRFIEGVVHEDVEFIPKIMLAAERIIEIPEDLYHYVVREDSISTKKDKTKNIRDLFWILELLDQMAEKQDPELRKWMKDAILNSYLSMIYDARMYQPQYRKYIKKSFLWGKAATRFNQLRVVLCMINIRLYCTINDLYKKQGK